MILQLEYRSSEEDMKELKELIEHEKYGGGPRWRSKLLIWLAIAFFGTITFLRFKMEIAPKDRPWFLALTTVAIILLFYFKHKIQHKIRPKTGGTVRLEISEQTIVVTGENSRTEFLWSGFLKFFETPNLFVLQNSVQSALFAFPKRAFPDAKAQEWFRTLANRPRNSTESAALKTPLPARFITSNGIALTLQYGFRDHLIRHITSWRVKGMVLGILAVIIGASTMVFINPPPDAVEPPGKAVLSMMTFFVPATTIVFFLIFVLWWFLQKKQYITHHVLITAEGIEFIEQNANGRMPWDTYKYYRETRWTFFIWHPQGSLWTMFPKRAFASSSDLDRFRVLLQTNLTPSRWFFM